MYFLSFQIASENFFLDHFVQVLSKYLVFYKQFFFFLSTFKYLFHSPLSTF
jgi:hypothetical protein